MSHEQELMALGLFSLEKRRLRVDFVGLYKCLKGVCRQEGAGVSSSVTSDSMRAKGLQLHQGRFRWILENISSVQGLTGTGTGCTGVTSHGRI